ncbi:MAG: DEAD/DEAH box helicase [Deltaproteobacteria bacterium]|nr:DEAD/DEAH box helicase [Deltaproteobacteria bacterium]
MEFAPARLENTHDAHVDRSDGHELPATSVARFRLRIAAEELSLRRPAGQPGQLAHVLRKASIDLNPHQVDAAVSGLASLRDKGLVLADEVGLGKTIEAGLILSQLSAEGRGRILVLVPASLRRQWANELHDKLGLPSEIVDGAFERRERRSDGGRSVFERGRGIVIASHPFAARRVKEVQRIPWDLVVIDEAHRLRGAHRGSKTALALRSALDGRPKLLLTATPLQNGLTELYGLLSFLDPEILGPYEAFRRAFPESPDANVTELKGRVAPYVHRTLRRQVREYVRYTDRRSMVVEFSPTPAEQDLYDRVTEYLSEPDTLAIEPSRRPLMVLVYRKLLASSPAAIAGTLEALERGLAAKLEERLEELDVDHDADELLDQIDDLEAAGIDPSISDEEKRAKPTPQRLRSELERLGVLAALARSIKRPAKTEALLFALERAFVDAISRCWPEKAVIFTESRRTQDALAASLEESGYSVRLLHGGSGDADQRAAIIEDFRINAKILLLTEAGAEGLNLQFANVVVNYDLPWNPQRIEQRIGRCHRYGQTRDVVVLNFLASENAAEARLYELLSQKLELFDGVFGATDEPLGALGDGADFERKVGEIFQSCRNETAIREAFDSLQSELEGRIKERYASARAAICEHFDDEIRQRLRMTEVETGRALDRDEHSLVQLVQGTRGATWLDANGRLYVPGPDGATVLETSRRHRTGRGEFLTIDHPLAKDAISELVKETGSEVRYVLFEYTRGGHRVSRLAPLLDSQGWWLTYRVAFDGPLAEDHLVHVVLFRSREGEILVGDDAQIEALLDITSRDIERRSRMDAATVASRHAELVLEKKIRELEGVVEARAEGELRRKRNEIDLGLEDTLLALAENTREAQAGWRRARDRGDNDTNRRFTELKKALDREAQERQRAVLKRAERLSALDEKSHLHLRRTLVSTVYFWLE